MRTFYLSIMYKQKEKFDYRIDLTGTNVLSKHGKQFRHLKCVEYGFHRCTK